jgi:hypothetical protein
VKWKRKGFLSERLVSEDGKWEMYYDEFSSVVLNRCGTNKGWYLGCRNLNEHAIRIAEEKIKGSGYA